MDAAHLLAGWRAGKALGSVLAVSDEGIAGLGGRGGPDVFVTKTIFLSEIEPPPAFPAVNAPTRRTGDAYVQSSARGLSVIRAFRAERPSMTLSEVAAAAGLTRAGARRILLTLVQLGYVSLDERKFRLTARILDLGFAYLSSMPFWNLAEPIMEALVEQVHESSSASVLEGTDIVYVLRVPTHKIMTITLGPGSRLPP